MSGALKAHLTFERLSHLPERSQRKRPLFALRRGRVGLLALRGAAMRVLTDV